MLYNDQMSFYLAQAFGEEAVTNIRRVSVQTRVRGNDVVIQGTKGPDAWHWDISLLDAQKLGLAPVPTEKQS